MGLIATIGKKEKKEIPSLYELIVMGNYKTMRNILITV